MVVAAAQPACTAYDIAGNAQVHAAAVRAARARLVVLPELSLTGYELDAAPVALNDPRPRTIVGACAVWDQWLWSALRWRRTALGSSRC